MNKNSWEFNFKMIKLLDTNENAFDFMYNEPVFTNPQWNKLINNLLEFEAWLIKIIIK
jgi:hypothetical protein